MQILVIFSSLDVKVEPKKFLSYTDLEKLARNDSNDVKRDEIEEAVSTSNVREESEDILNLSFCHCFFEVQEKAIMYISFT